MTKNKSLSFQISSITLLITFLTACGSSKIPATHGSQDSSKNFNTLISAGNDTPKGIWSDGTTMWVANEDDKIHAYELVN